MARRQKRRFDLRKRKADGMWVRWEQIASSELGIVDREAVEQGAAYDHVLWVITGVYKTRKQAFAG